MFTIFYIAPFYLSPTLRASPLSSRDSPAVIRARIRAVGLSCAASTIVTLYIIIHFGHGSTWDVLRLLGIWPIDLFDIVKVLALVAILFSGPLFESLVVDGEWRSISYHGFKATFFDSWVAWRNHSVSPVSEELVFRSLVISLYLLAKVAPSRIVLTTPLIFGIAHVHHLVEFVQSRIAHGQSGTVSRIVLLGVVRSLFQFTYTSLFGFFAAFVYLRTGNLFAAIVAHSFCNVMGFPRLWGKVGQRLEADTATPDIALGKRDDSLEGHTGLTGAAEVSREVASRRRVPSGGTKSTIIYYLLLVVGAFAFYRLLWPLTESKNALATFWKFV